MEQSMIATGAQQQLYKAQNKSHHDHAAQYAYMIAGVVVTTRLPIC